MTHFLATALDITQMVVTLVVALSPLVVPFLPALVPLVAGALRNQKHAQAFAAVTRMGLLATNVVAEEIRKGLQEATFPSSPGGATVTEGEKADVMARAVAAAFRWAQEQRAFKQVVDVYGGEDAVRSAVEAFVANKIHGSPIGEPPSSANVSQRPYAVTTSSSGVIP